MKKVLFIFFVMMVSLYSFAQVETVMVDEHFEDGPDYNTAVVGWTQYEYGTPTASGGVTGFIYDAGDAANFSTYVVDNATGYNGTIGSFSLVHNDNSGENDTWIVYDTPLSIPDTALSAELTFQWCGRYGPYSAPSGLYYEILTGSSDPGTATVVETLISNGGSVGWAPITVDLSAYIGQDIYFGFRYIGNLDSEFGIDEVYASFLSAASTSGTLSCFLACPGDMTITLDAGECAWPVAYDARTVGCDPAYDSILLGTPAPLVGFVDPFDPSDFVEYDPNTQAFPPDFNTEWTLNGDASTYGPSMIDLDNLPDEITMYTYADPGCPGPGVDAWWNYTMVNFVATKAGTLTFDWTYHTDDSFGAYWDDFGYMNGSWVLHNIYNNAGADDQNGTFSIDLSVGESFTVYVRTLDFFDCGAYATLSNLVFQEPEVTDGIVLVDGPYLGTEVAAGETETVTLVLLNNGIGVDTCSFDIHVQAYPHPTTTLACNDQVQISVDADCEAYIGADMILEGGPYGCYDDYNVEIFTSMPSNTWGAVGNVSNPAPTGSYWVGIYDATGNNCWSYVTVVDKMPPTIDCSECPPGGLLPYGGIMTEYPGELLASDPQATIGDCWDFDFGPLAGAHPIDVIPFNVTTTGSYTISVSSSWQDAEMAIYNQPVNFDNMCLGVIGGANDVGGSGIFDPGTTLNLTAGITYYLAISNWSATGLGTYTVSFSGAGSVIYLGVPIYDEACTYVGCNSPVDNNVFPVPEYSDNCETHLTYTDVELPGLFCGTKVLRRTFTVRDNAGMSATCTQEYFFTGVDLTNFAWPLNFDGLPQNHPMLECDGTYPLDSNGNPHPAYTGYPDGYDDYCGTIEVFYNDAVYHLTCGIKILRTWTVVDDCTGTIKEHTQIIRIDDTHGPSFMVPDNMAAHSKAYECVADFEVPAIMHLEDGCDPAPVWWVTASAGTIVGDGTDINGDGDYLDHFGALYEVAPDGIVNNGETWYVVDVPMGSFKLCYHAMDNCGNVTTQCVTLTVYDDSPPIPVCEQFKQVSLTADGSAKVFSYDFDSGSFDNCGNTYFKVLRVNNDFEYDGGCINLNGDDDISASAPGIQSYFDDEVFFCCEDIGNDVMVTLRVMDKNPGSGPVHPARWLSKAEAPAVTDAARLYGHYNDCWTMVHVECKMPPALHCSDVTITCEESLDPEVNTALKPEVQYVCNLEDLGYYDINKGDVCTPYVERHWTATACGKTTTCKQNIYITDGEPFDPCTIKMPADVAADCKDGLDSAKEPEWDERPCNVVTAEIVKEDTFKFVDGACYKILREWAVIDWCVYEQNTGAEDDVDVWKSTRYLNCKDSHYANGYDGYYRYTQVLMLTDRYEPEVVVSDTCVASVDCNAYKTRFYASADDECNAEQKFWWKYEIINMDTWKTVQYSYNWTSPMSPDGIVGKRNDDKLDGVKDASFVIRDEISLPIGNYRVTWIAGDGCGNAATKYQYVTVADKKAPTPVMVDIATAVMQNGMVELKARWFDKGGCGDGCISCFDNCTPTNGLYFTFTDQIPRLWEDPNPANPKDEWLEQYLTYGKYFFDPATGKISTEANFLAGKAHAWYPESRSSSRVWLCDWVEEGNTSITVQVYVWDQFALNEECDDNNYDYANVIVNFNHCVGTPQPMVAGTVTSYNDGASILNMNMLAQSETTSENKYSVNSDASGQYEVNVIANDSYAVSGSKDIDYANGVTTLDLVLIQKYLLGLKNFSDPFMLIAADMNNDGSVKSSDLVSGRNLILGKTNTFENHSWITINTEYVFINPTNAAAEMMNACTKSVGVAAEAVNGVDFKALKVGDVNMSAGQLAGRSSSSIKLMLDDATVKAGQTVEIPFYAEDFAGVYGTQFVLNMNGMTLESVQGGALDMTEGNYRVSGNNLLVSWNDANGVNVENGSVLFTLKVKANAEGSISNMLQISDNGLRSEIYAGEELEIKSLKLAYRNSEATYALYQNQPNPFVTNTTIGFDLPTAAEYTLTVYDVTGKQVIVRTATGEAGYNTVSISNKDINTVGVLYYRIESGEFTATKKMVMIK